jgi:hypothetical protein
MCFSSLRYHDHTTAVEPPNIVWMWMCSCSQAKLLDYLTVYQAVALTVVDDGENMTIVHNEEVKQVLALNLVLTINLCTQRSLHNDGSVLVHVMSDKDLLLTHLMIVVISCNVSCSNIIILNIRSTNIATVSSSDVGMFARTSCCMWPSPWQRWHLISKERRVEGEDKVVFGNVGVVVVFADV